MGKISEVTWIHRMKDRLDSNSPSGDDQNRTMVDRYLKRLYLG